MLLKDTTDQAALRRFASQYPDSRFRKDAEARIAALEATRALAVNPVDAHELARSLQFELKRVGCFVGTANGEFDDATRAAWYSFGKVVLIKLPDEETPDAVKAVRAIEKRVCPLVCSDGERAKGDRCVAIAPQNEPAKKEARNGNRSGNASPRNSEPCAQRVVRPQRGNSRFRPAALAAVPGAAARHFQTREPLVCRPAIDALCRPLKYASALGQIAASAFLFCLADHQMLVQP